MFLHPKTGVRGSENITDESKSYLYKKVLGCIKSGELYKLELNEKGNKIIFKQNSAS